MLKKKQARKAIDKHSRGIRKRLRAFRKTGEPEELHKLRVEVKKLRALLLLEADALDSGDLPGEFKAVKNLFRDAALVRTPHVTLQLLDKYKIPGAAFRKKQETELKTQAKKFHEKIAAHLKALKPARKFFLGEVKNLREKHVLNMLRTQVDQLSALFAARKPAQLHDCRKKLKNLLYIHAELDTPVKNKLRLGKLYLAKLQETIGEWHDVFDARALVAKVKSGDKALAAKLREEAMRLEKRIFTMTENFGEKAVRR